MRERARSVEDKGRRSEDLLAAVEALAVERGGVRFVTVAAVTERVGLHRTGVRRYYASREELLLEAAEHGWNQWRAAVTEKVRGRSGLDPVEVASALTETIAALPVFCDLLAHAAMTLEGDVDIERARRYKSNATAAHDEILLALGQASGMTLPQLQALAAATVSVAASLWQAAHPTPTLAALYEQEPEWGHAALNFEPRLTMIIQATAIGLERVLPV